VPRRTACTTVLKRKIRTDFTGSGRRIQGRIKRGVERDDLGSAKTPPQQAADEIEHWLALHGAPRVMERREN